MADTQLSLFSKMCRESSRRESPTAKISESSSKKSSKSSSRQPLYLRCLKVDGPTPMCMWVRDGRLATEFSTLNTGEKPSEAEILALYFDEVRLNAVEDSTLSSILEANVPERYYLSPTACEGILRRAERRGKQLPEMLKLALEQMIERERAQETEEGEDCMQ